MKNIKRESSGAFKSKKMITQALISLMEEKDYSKITVAEITKRADLVRRTFYSHFKNKEEVLVCYINQIIEEHIQSYLQLDDHSELTIAEIYFKLWAKHLDFVLLLKNNDLLILLKGFEKYIEELDKAFSAFKCLGLSESAAEYAPKFYAGALWSTLDKWIEKGMEESPAELGKLFSELIGW
ncbi:MULTISPECIES: TetR/AcrR family transcriptional regulator [Halanaerobium]|jgi:AcrR family transcriptional regulator|uniref:Regulatory protein, tetR family n=2 Tax=Halanaerobium TaxID=2330 RepID=A0A1G6JWK1_9FIRM|nr:MULTISPECIES: TetR/AcrR family transcriptional regulator [Halanaerobium]KXS47155.1 MAG: regulatory protein TetR [Halanaerobium sp. T82-1]PUU86435.1 MAG: regulatory protein TetR [Halanaerobium sp.]TDO86477.1 TetR family transcriptional regulator [Halanaerobium saccharolyticum]TDP09447.1 TetR family transcriptional regulator [Halanaerobium congolense]SDC23038.1 regulatory protein, tetR family [Halanaerobium congolense]